MNKLSYSERVLALYKNMYWLIDPEDMRESAAEIAKEADVRIKELEAMATELAASLEDANRMLRKSAIHIMDKEREWKAKES